MNKKHAFLIDFFVITIGIAAAFYHPLYGVPFCLLSMAALRFLICAKQDNPRSVRLFIALACAAMVSVTFAIPYRWLTGPAFRMDATGLVLSKPTIPPYLWSSILLITWGVLFHFLLRRYRFTEATARVAMAEEVQTNEQL